MIGNQHENRYYTFNRVLLFRPGIGQRQRSDGWHIDLRGLRLCDSLNQFCSSGYTVVSNTPPHIQSTATGDGPGSGAGAPHLSVWDLVPGRHVATRMVYSRAMIHPEVQMMHQNLEAKVTARGMTVH